MNNNIRAAIKKAAIIAFIPFCFFAGCGRSQETIVTNKDSLSDSAEETDTGISLPFDTLEEEKEEEMPAGEETSPETEEFTADKAKEDTFREAVAYLSRTGGKTPEIDYDTLKYAPQKRNPAKEADKRLPKEIEEKTRQDEVKAVRMLRSGNGATLDFRVYTDPEDRFIDKIVSTEYGSDGREVTGFYYDRGKLIYVYRYTDDLYGINAEDARKSGGLRCYFKDDSLLECYATYGDKNESVTAASYKDVNDDIKKEYDELEEELINRAYANVNALKSIPGTATVFGYVADEYGGTLANTKVTIKSEANDYEKTVTANEDGYYEIQVPVNTADWYNMEFEYGDYAVSRVCDVYIRPLTIEYPIGVTYMAPEGQNVHDKETYLLDVTKQSPDKLKDNQYEVVLSFNNEKIEDLTPFALNIDSGKYENNKNQIITVDGKSDYKYFVTDQKNGRSGNNLTNDLSLSEVQVKVYNKNSLVASFQAPVGRSGVVWEVFEIKGADIIPSGNLYFETGKELFFK